MLTGIVNKDEREYASIFQRYGRTRKERYLEKPTHEATMVGVIKELLTFGVKSTMPSEATVKFINESIEKGKTLGYKDGMIAMYKGEYVIVFLKVKGLDHCALKLTHNAEERKLLNEFYMSSTAQTRLLLSVMCLNILREKQRVNLLNGKPTYGIVYSNYPEKDEVIDTFVRYINVTQASQIANVNSIYAVNAALERGCTEEEILSIIPKGIENKFFNVQWTDYEIAQINALEPGISALA